MYPWHSTNTSWMKRCKYYKKKKMKVKSTLTTIDGTLYENDIVFVEGTEKNGDLRVKDSMGRIWFLNKEMLK